jgi:RNA recognition motif-containing protein
MRVRSYLYAVDTGLRLVIQLPYRVRWQDLKDLFRKAGTVLRADVSLGPDNRSRGHGTVLYANAEDAGRAVDMFHGYSWQTRILEVRLDRLLPLDLDANPPASCGSGYGASGLMPSYAGVPLIALGLTAVPGSSNLEFGTLYGPERPVSTSNVGRNLFVGNVSRPAVRVGLDMPDKGRSFLSIANGKI